MNISLLENVIRSLVKAGDINPRLAYQTSIGSTNVQLPDEFGSALRALELRNQQTEDEKGQPEARRLQWI